MESNTADPILSDRINAIVATEKSIDDMMKCAREIIQDLGKEKQIGKNKMEDNANTFKKLITQVENELSAQMQYLSHVCVGSSHQGSTFGVLQNSLLAQSGLSSLHSELATVLKKVDPHLEETTEEEVVNDSENIELIEGLEDAAARLSTSSSLTSPASGRGSGVAPEEGARSSSTSRSQEGSGRRDGEEEEMEQ
uniref:Mediator of RNA polymerase II transcription subunit 11 n=1 Tax=Caenorhabditis tropicalis TaxID=1561998 RepID=A0A1I7U374_9PELO